MNNDAIDIMEPGTQPTDEQLRRLETDAQLSADCLDLFLASQALGCTQPRQPDVEAQLRRLHSRIDQPQVARRTSLKRLWWLAAAAAVVLAVVVWWPKDMSNSTAQPEANVPMQVFTAAGVKAPAQLATATGRTVSLRPVSRQAESAEPVVTVGSEELPLEERLELTVPNGESLQLLLPDGTQVYMHPDSRLAYPSRFTGSQREVSLDGEAYFVVAHDAEHPFVVSTRCGRTVAVGTQFNISTRQTSAEQVTLVEGSVRVEAGGHELLLHPGQQVTLSSHQSRLTPQDVDTEPYTAWRDGYFYFDEVPLRDILTAIGRYYNVNVRCVHTDQLDLRMRFIIPRRHDVGYAVEMINRMQKVTATLTDNCITL